MRQGAIGETADEAMRAQVQRAPASPNLCRLGRLSHERPCRSWRALQGGEHRVVKLAAEALDLLSDSDDDSHAQPDLSNARGRQPSHRLSAGTIWPLVADRRE